MEIETRGESPELNDYMERYAIRILESEAKMHDNKVYINSLGKAISGSSDKELVDLIKIYDVWKQFIRGAPL